MSADNGRHEGRRLLLMRMASSRFSLEVPGAFNAGRGEAAVVLALHEPEGKEMKDADLAVVVAKRVRILHERNVKRAVGQAQAWGRIVGGMPYVLRVLLAVASGKGGPGSEAERETRELFLAMFGYWPEEWGPAPETKEEPEKKP